MAAKTYIFDPHFLIIEEQTVFASAAEGDSKRFINQEELANLNKRKQQYILNIVGYDDDVVSFDFGIEKIIPLFEFIKGHQPTGYHEITNGIAKDAAQHMYNETKILKIASDMQKIYENLNDDNKKVAAEDVNTVISEYEKNIEVVTIALNNIEAHKNLEMKTLIKVKSIYGEVIDLVITTLLSMFGCLFLMTGVIHGSLIPLIFWWIELDMIERMEGGAGDKGQKRAYRKRFFEILFSYIFNVGTPDVFSNTRAFLELLCQGMNRNPSSMFFSCITGGSVFYICASALLNIYNAGNVAGNEQHKYNNLNEVNKMLTIEQFRSVFNEIIANPELIELIKYLSADGNSDIDIKICINKCPEAERANYLKIAEELFKKHERESGLPIFSLYYGLLFGPAFGPATTEVPDPINNALDGMPPSDFFAEFERGAYGRTAGFQMSRYQWAERSEADVAAVDVANDEANVTCKTACDSLGISNVYAQMVQESGLAQFDRLLAEGHNSDAIEYCRNCYKRALEKKATIKRLTRLVSQNVGSYNLMITDPTASGFQSRFYMLQKITQVISTHLETTYPLTSSQEYHNILIAHASIEMLNSRRIINGEKTSTPVFMLPQIMMNLVAIPEIRGIILLSQAANDASRGFTVDNAIGIVRANPSIETQITSRDIAAYFRKTLRLQIEERQHIDLAPNTRVSFSIIAKPHGTQNKDAADIAEAANDGEDIPGEAVTGGGSWGKTQYKIKNNSKIKKARKTKRTNPRKTKQRKQPKQKISKKRSKK